MNAIASLVMTVAAAIQADGMSAREHISEGMKLFQAGDVAGSLEQFDAAASLDKSTIPQLWQRGISYYYAGRYREGRQQFETHKSVNPHDVENAAWHYLCVAQQEDVEAARKAFIEIDTRRDTRVPLKEVYELYGGTGSPDKVMAAATESAQPRATMYAHLYLGLFYEVAGDEAKAKSHLESAAAIDLPEHYMRNVAKVHLEQRGWQAEEASAAEPIE